ncbi:preprotein translocase subunit SecA [Flavobacterium faecale]|uniref:Preprotein translocase subunit SecA n=1 Tax=Flavobacterium faecale TaxID=1355330 RepID=A0A2S1LFB9_9FLAO|nr:YchJ family metal-binding protein [Flavobacterium faecale]AWG22399.1 preprotein translocase subunit SecA [Flavobacterium faecale]
MAARLCYCCSGAAFSNCCEPILEGRQLAIVPEQLMRSRYTAFAIQNADYLVATTHISTRKHHNKEDILDWSKANQWIKLSVLEAVDNKVRFKAYYKDENGIDHVHHEYSTFKQEGEQWYYVDGTFL